MAATAPRIYCIPATGSPLVAVFRRGPSDWWHLARWDPSRPTYEPGAWFRGRLYPRRCDLSPDGRWLSTFALRPSRWSLGDTYCAISRLPWLTALAAWPTCGTWTRGLHFVEGGDWELGEPEHGDASACRRRYGLRATRPAQFATELRRGWQEAPDSPPRQPGDSFDSRRNAILRKAQPGGRLVLRVQSVGSAGGEWQAGAVEGLAVRYGLEHGETRLPLEEAQWADWDDRGRLLLATREGQLQIRRFRGATAELEVEEDLRSLEPDPQPAPSWARSW